MSWFDRMKEYVTKAGGNPYHDAKGRFTHGGGEASAQGQDPIDLPLDKFSAYSKAHSEEMRSLAYRREAASHAASLDPKKNPAAREATAAYDQASRDYANHPHGPRAQKAESIRTPKDAREAMDYHADKAKDARFPKDVQAAHQRAAELHSLAADSKNYDNAIANVANALDASKAAHEKEMVARAKMQEEWTRRGIKAPKLWMGASH